MQKTTLFEQKMKIISLYQAKVFDIFKISVLNEGKVILCKV